MMGTMSPEPQATSTDSSEPAAVLEWGGEAEGPTKPSAPRGRRPARLAREFLGDRRLVPLAAGLGGVGMFASLLSEWQVTAVDGNIFGDSSVGNRPIPSGVGELGGWGGGYLVGVLLLTTAVVILLFGPVAGRRYARLAAVSTGGVLLAMLAALASDLDGNSRALDRVLTIQLEANQFQVAYGRGVWCALFGVAAMTLAAYLAGRHLAPEPARSAAAPRTDKPAVTGPAVTGPAATGPAATGPAATRLAADRPPGDEPQAGEPGDEFPERAGDWLWRRPTSARDDDEVPGTALELTVSPATPFTPQSDDRDKLR